MTVSIRCPECGEPTRTLDTRTAGEHNITRRRRVCPNGHRTTTYEIPVPDGEAAAPTRARRYRDTLEDMQDTMPVRAEDV